MTNYLVMPKNTPEHYFYRSGIYMKKQSPSGIWQEPVPVFTGGRDGFSVYCSQSSVHLICTDYSNNLIYAVLAGDEWKKYAISTLSSDIAVLDMRLYSVRGRLNLMYSALYNGENLLVHCILGDRAKPATIDILETPHFFIKDSKAFYTNSNGVFGSVNLSDEKPSVFTPIYEDAHFGTVYNVGGRERILFSRNSSVFLDGKELAHDTHLEMPILADIGGKIYVMWKSGSFIRYIMSLDGENFSEPKRFMSSGKAMNIYTVQKGRDFKYYYGYETQTGAVLFGNPDVFEISANYNANKLSELERVKNMLNKTQQEITDAKKEIARLGKVISSLTDKT